MQAIIQIIKVNDARSGLKDGRAWEMQDCECILLNDDMSPSQVGVLMLPKELRNNTKPGVYTGAFSLQPDLRTRRIEAVLTSLIPFETKTPTAASSVSHPPRRGLSDAGN